MSKRSAKAKAFKKFNEGYNTPDNVSSLKMIHTDNLIDYPNNKESITDTSDLEISMIQLGFTDPIEVTNFNMPDDVYMIISGHRRRKAALKVNIDTFPCIVKSFVTDADLANYVLFANSQRDSSKDPLLFCTRYKMHAAYLISINFLGPKREEIARRLGISVAQADRYKQFNNIIECFWDLVRQEKVGMSSILQLSNLKHSEQFEIYTYMIGLLNEGVPMTRQRCEYIISHYKINGILGKVTEADPSEAETTKENNKFIEVLDDTIDLLHNNNINDKIQAKLFINKMCTVLQEGLDEMNVISNKFKLETDFKKELEYLESIIRKFNSSK